MTAISIKQAAQILNQSGNIGFPTETVYGLAARIDMPIALENIFKIKNRPYFDPLIVHVSSLAMAELLVTDMPLEAKILAHNFWPGPLTMILPKNENIISSLITSGSPYVGIRCPDHLLALEIISEINCPLAAPSANPFKATSPTQRQHVENYFGEHFPVLDGGNSEVGIESTIIKINSKEKIIEILRVGQIGEEDIKKHLEDYQVVVKKNDLIAVPGELEEHYRPRIPLIVTETNNLLNEFLLSHKIKIEEISELNLPVNSVLFMRNLYQELHHCSKDINKKWIFINLQKYQSINQDHFYQASLERLFKAASVKLLSK